MSAYNYRHFNFKGFVKFYIQLFEDVIKILCMRLISNIVQIKLNSTLNIDNVLSNKIRIFTTRTNYAKSIRNLKYSFTFQINGVK